MAWKMLEKPKTVVATKSLIREFVDMVPAPYDRPLSERRMMVYERIRKAGDFRVVTWASAHCVETNCVYRVNGKHTSLMLSKEDPLRDFYVTVERYQCDTLNDVARLYNTFDSNLSSRTASDVNLAFAATLPELRDVPHRLIHLAVSAIAYNKWDEPTLKKISPAERAEELVDRVDFVKWLQDVIPSVSGSRGNQGRFIQRSAVVSAMLSTYDRSPVNAKAFWIAVRDETDPSRDSPSRVLARWLIRATIGGGGNRSRKEQAITNHREMYVKCLHAWNAWRKGETTNLNYYASAPIPTVAR